MNKVKTKLGNVMTKKSRKKIYNNDVHGLNFKNVKCTRERCCIAAVNLPVFYKYIHLKCPQTDMDIQ